MSYTEDCNNLTSPATGTSAVQLVEEISRAQMTPAVKDLVTKVQSVSEAFVGLLHILMAECGFYTTKHSKDINGIVRDSQFFNIRYLDNLKVNVEKNELGVFCDNFVLQGYAPVVKLRCIPNDNKVILVNASVPTMKLLFSSAFKLNNFVINSSSGFVFLNMKTLSIKFKNAIPVPIKASILNSLGIVNSSFKGLPIELIDIILKFLSNFDRVRVKRIL